MKLTKGKISKLYRKNKQSLKRYKKKETNKNKSFRKRGHVNLRNKSLKNYRGGQEKEELKKSNKKTETLLGPAPAAGLPEISQEPSILDDNSYPPESLSGSVFTDQKKENNAIETSEPGSIALEKKSDSQVPVVEGADSTQKELEDVPEVTDSQAAASPFLAEVKSEKEEDGLTPQTMEEGIPAQQIGQQETNKISSGQTESVEEALPEVSDSQAAASPFLAEVKTEKEEGVPDQINEGTGSQNGDETGAQISDEIGPQTQTGTETNAQTSEETGSQSGTETGAQTSEEIGAQSGTETGAQTSEETGAQTSEETGAQTSEETGAQTSEETGAQISDETEAQTSEETGAQISDKIGVQSGTETAPQTSEGADSTTTPSDQGLPENVSIAAKTILDYAMGSLAKQINSGSTISQGVQNPESSFTNMTNTFASQGGRSLKNKIRVKGKKTRKH